MMTNAIRYWPVQLGRVGVLGCVLAGMVASHPKEKGKEVGDLKIHWHVNVRWAKRAAAEGLGCRSERLRRTALPVWGLGERELSKSYASAFRPIRFEEFAE